MRTHVRRPSWRNYSNRATKLRQLNFRVNSCQELNLMAGVQPQVRSKYASIDNSDMPAAAPLRKVTSLTRGRVQPGLQARSVALPHRRRVHAVSIADALDTSGLIERLARHPQWRRRGWTHRVWIGGIVRVGTNTSCVYFFPFGVAVSWSCSSDDEAWLFSAAAMADYSPREEDDMSFRCCNGDVAKVATGASQRDGAPAPAPAQQQATIINDEVALATSLATVESLAVSFAFAQSIKLSLHENSAEQATEEMRPLPHNLARTGKVGLGERQISMRIGQIFVLRNSILDDFLDSPEFLWEDDLFEPSFACARRYLNLDARISALNARLDTLNRLLDILLSQADALHANRLELLILYLILIEVFLMILFWVLDHFKPVRALLDEWID